MDFLGPDREAIGREKAGIFRAGIPAICGDPQPPQSCSRTRRIGAGLQVMGGISAISGRSSSGCTGDVPGETGGVMRRGGLAFPALRGERQLANATCALAALDALARACRWPCRTFAAAWIEVELPGRFQVLPGRPAVVLDVAHNPQAARVLAATSATWPFTATPGQCSACSPTRTSTA
jgi:dihydrofolate synthase/folylpolyglutamate synthase